MKISPQILKMRLETWGFGLSGNVPGRGMYLGRPVFYTETENEEEERLYILPGGTRLPDRAGTKRQVFVTGPDAEPPSGAKYTILRFSSLQDSCKMMNAVQRVFDFYDAWEEALYRSLDDEGDLQTLLDESMEVFGGNPLTVSTADFFLLAHSSVMDEKEELRELLDPNNLFEFCTAFKQDEEYNKARTLQHAFYYPGYITGYRNLCVNIFDHGIYTYRIAIPETLGSFQPGMQELLEFMAGFVAKYLKYRYRKNSAFFTTLHQLLVAALKGESGRDEQRDRRLQEYGWSPRHSYICLDFKTAMLDQQNLTVNFICRHIEALIPNSCAFPYEEDIVAFVNLTRFGKTVDEMFRSIIIFLRDSYLKVGASRCFTGFEELGNYYLQAKAALEAGNEQAPYQWSHRFEDAALGYMLRHCTGKLPPRLWISEKLGILKEHDREHRTEFYRTLKLFLENNLNTVRTAKELYIHRSTFLYRMERIKEMTGVDLDNRDQRLYLMISFRLMELEES